jgi:hypothetical protein
VSSRLARAVTGRALRLSLPCLLALAALAGFGCGNRQGQVVSAETEGIYLDLGEMKYQVQMSRQLNPGDVQDRDLLRGLPAGTTAALPGDQTWFGVFMRVQNETGEPHPAADRFEIIDTDEKTYAPLELDPNRNPWVYRPGMVPPRTVYPLANSATDQTFSQGALLLFRLDLASYQNRPLELRVSDSLGTYEGVVDLDV